MASSLDSGNITRNKSLCLAVSQCLNDHGASRLDLLHLAIEGYGSVDVYFEGCWCFCVDAQNLPFILGVCQGLSNKDLCKIITSFSIDPVAFIQNVSFHDDYLLLPDKTKLSRMFFNKKMIDLFFELDAEVALATMKAHLGDSQMLAASFLASGRVGGLLDKMVNDEYLAMLCDEEVENETVQSVVSHLPFNLNSLDYFPGQSIDNYLKDSAAFNPHILKKTLSNNGYWEHVFVSSISSHTSTECCTTILEHVFSQKFSAVNKQKLGLMLSNLVIRFSENQYDYDGLFSETLSLVKNSAVYEFADKTIFHLSLLRGCLEPDVEPITLREIFNGTQLGGELAIGMFRSLIALDDRLFEQVIQETLSLPSHNIGYHLLSLPFALKALTLPKQKVENGLFERYLVTMAEAAAHFTTENDSLGEKQDMDFAIHEGMAHWFQYLSSSQQFDTGLLTRGSEQACEHLVRWGLDIHSLPAPSDKAMSFSLERDLGL
jgi:hypothetical protein